MWLHLANFNWIQIRVEIVLEETRNFEMKWLISVTLEHNSLVLCLPITALYFFQSTAEMFVEVRVSSTSSPMQYSRVLICLSSSSADRPDTRRNCSKRRFHQGHSSGVLKSKDDGGCNQMLAIPLLTPCAISVIGSRSLTVTRTVITLNTCIQQAQDNDHCYSMTISFVTEIVTIRTHLN